jgi:hypothetical protein
MSVSLAPSPVFQAFAQNGGFLAGGQLFTYIAGTSTPQATYIDATQTTQNTNPIILNAMGLANVWLLNGQTYKFVLYDANGYLLWSVDQIPGGGNALTAAIIGMLLWPQTVAEISAGVTPTNYIYPSGNILRYGADPSYTSDSATAIQSAVNVASESSGPVVFIPPGAFKVLSTINVSAGKQVYLQGSGKFLSFIRPSGFSSNQPVFNLQGTTGSRIDAIKWSDFAIWDGSNTALGITASWVINSVFDNIYFYQLQNGYVGADCFGIGFRNNNSYSISTTVYNLGANCNNCYFDKSRIASCNVGIETSNFCDTLTVIGCDFEGITSGGAAIFLFPATSTNNNNITIIGNHFENINGNAILCDGADANSVQGLVVKNNTFTGGFSALGNTNAVNAIVMENVTNWDISNNNFSDWGTPDSSVGGTQGHALSSVAGATNGVFENNTSQLTAALPLAVHNLMDATPAVSVRVANNWLPIHGTAFAGYPVNWQSPTFLGPVGVNGASPPAQVTGWGTPVGGAVVTSYNITDAGGANSNTNKAVAEIIAALKSFGLFGT